VFIIERTDSLAESSLLENNVPNGIFKYIHTPSVHMKFSCNRFCKNALVVVETERITCA